jgi:hypothetical protein
MDGSRQTSFPLWDTNGTDDTSSIILVQNIGVAYPDRREDPIFPGSTTQDGTQVSLDALIVQQSVRQMELFAAACKIGLN